MTIPVWVEQQNGSFTATMLGMNQLKATGESRDEAIRKLSELVRIAQHQRSLVLVNMPEVIVSEVPRRQPTQEEIEATDEMVKEIYRERDEDKAATLAEYDREEAARTRTDTAN